MEPGTVSVKKNVIEKDMQYNGETLLSYKIEYPEFSSPRFQECLMRINRFYRQRALKFKQYYETEMFRMAVEQYKEDKKNGFPVRMFGALQVYEITYLNACIISLYYDQYEYTGGAHGNTIRTAQTWQLQRCRQLNLEQLIRCEPCYKSYSLSQIQAQIEQDPTLYFDNYKELIKEAFDKNNFYCTSDGIIIYYQQYDIAPYSSGIREFLIPYNNCVLNPAKMCYWFVS